MMGAQAAYTIEEQRDIEQALSVLPRTIRPLPKRQRIVSARQVDAVHDGMATAVATGQDEPTDSHAHAHAHAQPAIATSQEEQQRQAQEDKMEHELSASTKKRIDEYVAMIKHHQQQDQQHQQDMTTSAKDYHDKANERSEPTLEYRPIDHRHHHLTPAADSPGALVGPARQAAAAPKGKQHQHIRDSSLQDSTIHEDGSTTRTATSNEATSSSPPTSPPASSEEPVLFDVDKRTTAEQYPLFGQPGDEIKKALARASIFSKAGLFGSLGLAALHPSLEHAGAASDDGIDDPDRPDHEEDVYNDDIRDRNSDHRLLGASLEASTGMPLRGNNKKKRKIPGVHRSLNRLDDEDDPYGEDTDEHSPSAGGRNAADVDDRPIIVPKVPADTPKTAKAALAKLAIAPPHISIDSSATSYRKQRRKRFRFNEKLVAPLKLSPLSTVHIPESYLKEPSVSPASTGLKGSRAVKAAKKLEKEREREKQRIRTAIGADNLKLPNLYDPLGRRKVKHDPVDLPWPDSLVPEADDDQAFRTSLDSLDKFSFVEPPSECVFVRWTALIDQMQHLQLAKERAAKAREEERERRLEKEKESSAAAAAAAPTPAPAASPPSTAPAKTTNKSPAPTPLKGKTPAVAKPSVAPSSAAAAPKSIGTSEPAPAPAISEPAKKTGSKKGKKKRSAYANANNVHHRINYVPSRMPSASGAVSPGEANGAHHANDGSLLSWPAADDIVAACSNADGSLPRFVGDDEWTCAFCDYELFFGEPSLLERAIRKRKKLLKVRRKAQQKAQDKLGHDGSAASKEASGTAGAAAAVSSKTAAATTDNAAR